MKKRLLMFLGLLCLVFLLAGVVIASEPEPQQQSSALVITKECSQVAALEAQIKAKRNDIKDVENQIKVLRNEQKAQKQASWASKQAQEKSRLEGLKQTDLQMYEQEMARRFERQKKHEAVRKQNAQSRVHQPRMTHEQWLDYIKKDNPAMYVLAIKKDALEKNVQLLRSLLKDARKACVAK